ncbi:hypothetical protein E4T43_00836 [Aureobasidium subglaciale]|nr:hypothetical protein E4T43_00836 [Aureobasidium subglaciale]
MTLIQAKKVENEKIDVCESLDTTRPDTMRHPRQDTEPHADKEPDDSTKPLMEVATGMMMTEGQSAPEEPRIDKPADAAKLAGNMKPTTNKKPASTKSAIDVTDDICAGIFGIHTQTKIIVREAGTVTSWIATATTQTNIVTLHKTTVVSIMAITQSVPRTTQTYTIRSQGLYGVANAEVYAL